MKTTILTITIVLFAMFTANAKPLMIDGKLVFDNFENYSWNEKKGGFVRSDGYGVMGEESRTLAKKYGKASLGDISKAQNKIRKAWLKWDHSRRQLEKMKKYYKSKRARRDKADLVLRNKRLPVLISEYIKKKPSSVSRSKIIKPTAKKTVHNESSEWYYGLDKLKKRQKELKKNLYSFNNYESINKKKIAAAKSGLRKAYLNMADVKSKAILKKSQIAAK